MGRPLFGAAVQLAIVGLVLSCGRSELDPFGEPPSAWDAGTDGERLDGARPDGSSDGLPGTDGGLALGCLTDGCPSGQLCCAPMQGPAVCQPKEMFCLGVQIGCQQPAECGQGRVCCVDTSGFRVACMTEAACSAIAGVSRCRTDSDCGAANPYCCSLIPTISFCQSSPCVSFGF